MNALKIVGSALAGAVGFLGGFYLTFFLVGAFWGLDFDWGVFPLIAGVIGGGFAGGAVAATVSEPRRLQGFLTGVGFGVVLSLFLTIVGADGGAMILWGAITGGLAGILVRAGVIDRLVAT